MLKTERAVSKVTEPKGLFEQYNELKRCKRSLTNAMIVLGVADVKEVPGAFKQRAHEMINMLEADMQRIVCTYVANLDKVKINKTTGGYYKTSAYALLKDIDTQGLTISILSTGYSAAGFKGSGVDFDIVSTSYSSVEERLMEAVTKAIVKYKQALQESYRHLQRLVAEELQKQLVAEELQSTCEKTDVVNMEDTRTSLQVEANDLPDLASIKEESIAKIEIIRKLRGIVHDTISLNEFWFYCGLVLESESYDALIPILKERGILTDV